ncbi:efflux RND transporter permease subunit [Coralloluteibacterium stylophorae]|uniref:Efflux RND transporter permease subunit n=1 Tax=Coralloluteibacterium stylophorae TaxID=1776034 RepID=A0A8J8AZJ1_9GAMM|nr:efflux RND transporter permease subunit [Coralloluteibacterium stylophorae]
MNISAPFVRRPVGTVLLTVGLALAGAAAFFGLPVAPLPQVDFPTISVQAQLPGASPETMASSVATPLERRLGVIPGVEEMTSSSSTGSTRITLQFALDRDIDGAAREVQAAINAAQADLPATLTSPPGYSKMNPADAPIMILALTSQTSTPGQIYDAAATVLQQALSSVDGVGEVELGGASLPAIRVEIQPLALARNGVSLEDVRAALQAANANRPKGAIDGDALRWQILTSQVGRDVEGYRRLVVAWRNGAPVRLGDVATVRDGVENEQVVGLYNGQPAVIVRITREPGANIVETVDAIRALVPGLAERLPAGVELVIASDSTDSIRASLHEIEFTLLVSILLVVLVVSLFLRSARATFIPAVATVVSILGTFGAMYLFGFSLNNLSLMALVVATGFVVDDGIVVLENIARHMEAGKGRLEATLLGAREVGFTVLSISLSLVAVFIPLLLMGGLVGRLFFEFSATLAIAVLISLVVSLTTTPMMSAWLLRQEPRRRPGRIARWLERGQAGLLRGYARSLDWALAHGGLMLFSLLAVVVLNVFLLAAMPKGFFPEQDSGRMMGGLRMDESVSFESAQAKLKRYVDIIRADPAVDNVVAFTGGRAGGGFLFTTLKPRGERDADAWTVIARLRPQIAQVEGASLFLFPAQDLRVGGRQGSGSYQYTLQSDDADDLRTWATRLAEALKGQPVLVDVDTDQQQNGSETFVEIDRDTAARLGVSARTVDNILYNGFGQRQVSTIYEDINQYRVVMEVVPELAQSPSDLAHVYVPVATGATQAAAAGSTPDPAVSSAAAASSSDSASPLVAGSGATTGSQSILRDAATGSALADSGRTMVPLSSFATFSERATPTSVNHQGVELATTISFSLAEGASLSDAQAAIAQAEADIGMPINVRGSFAGTAASYQSSLSQQPLLIAAAIVAIYIVLGILYESTLHPLTVLSTLPSAGIGATLALMLFGMEFSLIALIGLFLLIGIVKKNAILIIDFAIDAERNRGLGPRDAIHEACLMRFRPILMTTLAAALGALPLVLGTGDGAELRRPLGVAIIGGLAASQLLTLLTTPVVYLTLERLGGARRRPIPGSLHAPPGSEDPVHA